MKTIKTAFTKLFAGRTFWAAASLMTMAPLWGPPGCDFLLPPGGPVGGGSSESCGGLLGLACEDGEFCSYPTDAMCGAADQTGTCQSIPEQCTQQYAPVCGCDDQTYGNECEAHAAGVSVAAFGECSDDQGPSGEDCGGLQGLACNDGEFCNYSLTAMCGAADQTGTCQSVPEACTKEYEPVCGCDDQTYGNECEAHAAGVSVAMLGECPS